jgi:hypothetical protein
MNELRGCQKYSMGPNFIYFGAQKYGYRPIPSEIETEELMKLVVVLETMGNDVTLLKKWYRKDMNKVPPESILLPITTHLPHFLNKRMPKLQARGVFRGECGAGAGLGHLVGHPRQAPAHAEEGIAGEGKAGKASAADFPGDVCKPTVHTGRDAQLSDGRDRERGGLPLPTLYSASQVINGCISQTNADVRDHVILYTRILQVRTLVDIILTQPPPQNINLQNLKRASAFIDIADRFGAWFVVGAVAVLMWWVQVARCDHGTPPCYGVTMGPPVLWCDHGIPG